METKSKNKKGISACDYGTACDNDNAGRYWQKVIQGVTEAVE